MASPMPLELQVMQFVAEVQGEFSRFRVFRTGLDAYYLFDQLDPQGCSTGLQFPVLKRNLQPKIRSALANGVGHA
jgi:hypothetical protein